MTAKEYLYSVRTSYDLIDTKKHEILKLKSDSEQVSIRQNEPVKTSVVNDPMRIVDKIADLESEINREIYNLVQLKSEIRCKINALDDYRYIRVLTEYYINQNSWESVAELTGNSVRHTLRLHGEALQAFRKKYNFP